MIKKEHLIQRLLEILPGFTSWNLILFPYWGILIIPNVVAYYILAFNIYWFYQSLLMVFTALLSHLRIQASINYDWLGDLANFPDYQQVKHVIIIPTYKEPLYILQRTLASITKQTLPGKQLVVVVAMEAKEEETAREEKTKALKKEFGNSFRGLHFTTHRLVPGEVVGKASNERHAALWVKKHLINTGKLNINYLTATSCDADHTYHPNHFAALTFKFLDNPHRYHIFWQPAVMFYNNIWELPAITRVPNTLNSIFNLSQLPRRDRLVNAQNYSLSFKLLDEVGYWDPDKIPEDWGIFFKAFFKKQGKVEVEPIYLPLFADAVKSTSLTKTLKNQYLQFKRWAWGVSDDPWIIRHYFLAKDIPFWTKTTRLIYVVQAHFFWPVYWFAITIGLTLPSIINPRFARTTLGYMVPKFSSLLLTVAFSFLLVMFVFDYFYKPRNTGKVSFLKYLLAPLEFILMPITGFFFSALPGLDAHTRLMLGKYIEYKVTEKV